MAATSTGKAGISAKVANGGVAGLLSLAIVTLLVQFVPAFRSGIPPDAKPWIDGGAGLIAYGITAWWTTHRATMTELMTALANARALMEAEAGAQVTVPPPPPAAKAPGGST